MMYYYNYAYDGDAIQHQVEQEFAHFPRRKI